VVVCAVGTPLCRKSLGILSPVGRQRWKSVGIGSLE
jgi:hypothetical protein